MFLSLAERNSVINYASQNYMAFTDQLIALGQWTNEGPTSHPGIFDLTETLNLLVVCPFVEATVKLFLLETLLYSCEWKLHLQSAIA